MARPWPYDNTLETVRYFILLFGQDWVWFIIRVTFNFYRWLSLVSLSLAYVAKSHATRTIGHLHVVIGLIAQSSTDPVSPPPVVWFSRGPQRFDTECCTVDVIKVLTASSYLLCSYPIGSVRLIWEKWAKSIGEGSNFTSNWFSSLRHLTHLTHWTHNDNTYLLVENESYFQSFFS